MAYNHGVRVKEQATSLVAPVTGTAGLQVIIGTAPVNLVADPYKATNVPMIAYSFSEAVEQIGYSDDFKNYTLCQSVDACFRVLNVAPIILINVLDPKKHKKANEEQTVNVEKMQATVKIAGILADTAEVKANETALTAGTDYITTFDDDGYLVITLTAGGKGASAKTLKVNSTSIDPTAVTESDIIGGYNASTGAESGMELIRHIYPKFSMTPGLLLAPGWTQKPNVGIALAAKCEEINGVFTCECILDIDTTEAVKYTDCNDWKNKNGYTNKHAALLWPQVKVGTKQYAYSAIFGALTAYTDASNDDVPNLSPSNKLIGITGLCLEDGTEVTLDQPQANLLNAKSLNKILHSVVLGSYNIWCRDPYTVCVNGRYKVSKNYTYDVTGAKYQDTGITLPKQTKTDGSQNTGIFYPHKYQTVPGFGAVPVHPCKGSTSTGGCDGLWQNVEIVAVALRFGYCNDGTADGLRYLTVDNTAGIANWSCGAAVLLLPPVGVAA